MRRNLLIGLGLLAGLAAVQTGCSTAHSTTTSVTERGRDSTTQAVQVRIPERPTLLARLAGNTGTIICVAFSPDGRTLASGSEDKTVKLWDLSANKITATLEGHTHTVRTVAFSPDGKTLATGSVDKTVPLWDLASGKVAAVLEGHAAEIWTVAFSPDGKTLVSGGINDKTWMWDVATKAPIRKYEHLPEGVTSFAFSRDGKMLACGAGGGGVMLYHLDTDQTITLCDDRYEYVAPLVVFSPDGKTLASFAHCNMREAVFLWDVATGRKLATLQGHGIGGGTVLGFTPDGKTLVSVGYSKQTMFWDVATGANIGTFSQPTNACWRRALSPDGKTLATVGGNGKMIGLYQLSFGPPGTMPASRPATQRTGEPEDEPDED